MDYPWFRAADSHIWVMDDDGSNATQIIFDTSRNYEHVAVSFDRRYIVANLPDRTNAKGSVTYLFDLQNATEQIVAPDFHSLGGGGIDISVDGYIHGACLEVYEPGTDFINAFDIGKIALDGSTLTKLNLINDGDVEADVAVSEDGTLVTAVITAEVGTDSAHSEIRVYNADGTNIRTPHVATPPQPLSRHLIPSQAAIWLVLWLVLIFDFDRRSVTVITTYRCAAEFAAHNRTRWFTTGWRRKTLIVIAEGMGFEPTTP